MPTKHRFVSAVANGPDPNDVQTLRDWNDFHIEVYAPGPFTIATGEFVIMAKRLELTGSQRLTLEGTARLVII